ncbi:hypothetical protein [Vibrio hepatarius]|uniref:hypothetical protein n=1 Tax=Vibrio hepatarius TaxID=171383 RepID=UPI00142E1BF8|nr:hypothetical protein [Vibrio hepatarius]NIY83058.1 hypothetical protein [Vibrio hepatarius]NVJ56475.1 hypothetical protein [Vibrionaceae bacterium]
MNRVLSSIALLFIGFFTLLFSLVLAIPLTIVALVTGKRIQNAIKVNSSAFKQRSQSNVFEGEYEEVSK